MSGSGFSPRTVLGLVLAGAMAFVAMLYFIGAGDTGPGPDNGEGHAAGHGLTGYAGLASMLERQGLAVSQSRTPTNFDTEALLVLTPPANADADEIARIVRERRYTGPTLLILPKWFAIQPPNRALNVRRGWVQLVSARAPPWIGELGDELTIDAQIDDLGGAPADWQGLGSAGKLPDAKQVLAIESGPFIGLVRDSKGRDLVAYADDNGCYPVLENASGYAAPEDCDSDRWNLIVAFEPDLFNNYGLADRQRALLAARVIELAREGEDLPIVFDLTLNGLGVSRNLLTLAFTPPFLAATLCLLIALAIVGWRAFGRFGPPAAEDRAIAFGKARLAADAGGLVRRSKRFHLLGAPYAALIGRRLAAKLGLRRADPAAIEAALAARDPATPSFADLTQRLETARGASATLRAAHALHSLERTLAR